MIEQTVSKIIAENRPDIEDIENAEFITDGLFDSFDIVTLVSELDKTFGISIDGSDITPANFNTVSSIAALVEKSGGNK